MAPSAPNYWIPKGVILQDLDLSVLPTASLAVVGGRHYQVSGLARLVISCLTNDPTATLDLCCKVREFAPTLTDDQVRGALFRLAQLRLVASDDSTEKVTNAVRPRARSYFALRVPFLSQRAILPIAELLRPIFSRWCFSIVFPFLLLLQLIFWATHVQAIHGIRQWPHGWELYLVMIGSYLGLFAHELGHAAAANSRGVHHGPIGFAIYLIFPAFYTDVTPAWRLRRIDRIIVDLGGMYMSSLFATLALCMLVITGNHAFLLLTTAYDITIVLNLNPFIRMDGYWVLSDILGVPSLMMANRQVCKWLLLSAVGRSCARPAVLTLETKRRYVYLGYYAGFLAFMSWAVIAFYLLYLPHVIRSYPQLIRSIVASATAGGLSFALLAAVGKFMVAAIPVLGCLLYLLPVFWNALRAVANYDPESRPSRS